MTTVRELIQDLLLLDSNLEVYVASDAEGNDIRAFDMATSHYVDGDSIWGPAEDEDDYSDNAVVIWPV